MKHIIIVVVLVIFAAGGGYYVGANYSNTAAPAVTQEEDPVSPEVADLLMELGAVMRPVDATDDNVRGFLLEKYGPCWGIPEGQCRE